MIILTEEQKEKIKSGELTHKKIIEEHTKKEYCDAPQPEPAPVQVEDELVVVKRKLKEINSYYNDLKNENKRLRREVKENVEEKVKTRDHQAQLRARKNELMTQ